MYYYNNDTKNIICFKIKKKTMDGKFIQMYIHVQIQHVHGYM